MDVEIGNLSGTVRAMDGAAPLHPDTMRSIISAVLMALDERNRRERQAKMDTRVASGNDAGHEDTP